MAPLPAGPVHAPQGVVHGLKVAPCRRGGMPRPFAPWPRAHGAGCPPPAGAGAGSCGSGAGQVAQARQEETHKVDDERHGEAAADGNGDVAAVAPPP